MSLSVLKMVMKYPCTSVTGTPLIRKIMISIYLKNKYRAVAVLITVVALVLPQLSLAQGSITLSVSPTLFDMTASPTQDWSSNVRVINANEAPLKIYTDVVNFRPDGEGGRGSMSPVLDDERNGSTLAEWITVTDTEQLIPAEQTVAIPFTIDVPEDAAPGGHYAAILIGTRSFDATQGTAQVETAQVVTALVFLRVAGDIQETGQIRDFTTSRLVSEVPAMDFSIRFENTGNVHLQPQGNITITNMWGRERGILPINQNSQFGNVLPESIRKYNFSWSGDWSFADIGRYKAVATLAYGEQTKRFTDSTTMFWVIPWRALLLVLAIVVGLVWFVVWGIRLYIRRMLQLAGVTPELRRDNRNKLHPSSVSITAPLEEGILDLRSGLRTGNGSLLQRLFVLAKSYKVFLVICGALVIFIALFIWYLVLALSTERGYEASYEQNGAMVPVVQTETTSTDDTSLPVAGNTLPVITLVNRSGVASADDNVAQQLRQQGYDVVIDNNGRSVQEGRTVIVYDPALADQIVRLQSQLAGSLLSSYEVENQAEPLVTIYIGTDQASN
jgi:hypothetical protein